MNTLLKSLSAFASLTAVGSISCPAASSPLELLAASAAAAPTLTRASEPTVAPAISAPVAGKSVETEVPAAIDARLAALERRLAEMAAENRALRDAVNQDEVAIQKLSRLANATQADTKPAAPVPAVTFAGKETKLTVSGLMHVFAESGGAPDARFNGIGDRFQMRRLRLAFAGGFAENVGFKVESDFGNAAVAGNSGYRGQITDAFVAWTKYSALRLQMGQFKTPYGYEQLVPDSKTLFVERAISNDRLTVGRQIGAMATGDVFGKTITYSFGVFNGNGVNTGANDNTKFMTSGRLVGTVIDTKHGDLPVRMTVATNFFNTVDRGAFTGRRTGYGADTQLVVGPSESGFEWLRNDNHAFSAPAFTADGWNAYTAFMLTKQWQALLRFDRYDANTARPNGVTREWTYGLTYFLKGDDVKLSLNYLRGEQPAPLPAAGRFLGRVQVGF